MMSQETEAAAAGRRFRGFWETNVVNVAQKRSHNVSATNTQAASASRTPPWEPAEMIVSRVGKSSEAILEL